MNLATIIESHPADEVALIHHDTSIPYGELRDHVDALRGGLVGLGLERGDRVAIVAANHPVVVEALLAALGAGLVAVPLNPTSPPPEMARELRLVGARVVVAGPGTLSAVEAALAVGGDRVERVVAVDDPGGLGLERGSVEIDAWDELLGSVAVPVVDVEPTDPAVLVHTSGTAGSPRAAVLTHANLSANIDQMQSVDAIARRSDDVTYGVLPLFHIFGLNVVLLPALAVGATVVLAERFDPAGALDAILTHRVTALTGPPALWATVAEVPDLPPDTFATVRLAVSGAAKLPVEVAETISERFGLEVREGYGLTEASPVVSQAVGTDAPRGSIGRPLPGVEVRLVDEQGDDVLVGDVGEIHVRGPNVFPGYWEDPDATAAVLDADGWLHTGDLALVDDAGHLFIVDRLKDLVIVSGFNVAPAEVEEVLVEHPAVADAGVVGVPDPRTGEALVAHVVPEPGAEIDTAEIVAFVGRHLARYKCPTEVRVVSEIPRGLGGKVMRRELA